MEQEGEISQITNKSFSRYSINRDYDAMQNLAVELINQHNPNSYVITYKGIFDDISNPDWNFSILLAEMNYRVKTTIIGTPHINP